MKNIKIELLHHTPVLVLLEALEQPYMNENVNETLAYKIINVLKHESVGEHVVMNFLVKGVSRLELQEHMRHRISSTTCRSTRYTLQFVLELLKAEWSNDDIIINEHFVTPDYIKENWQSEDEYFEWILDLKGLYLTNLCRLAQWKNNGVKNDYIKYGLHEGFRTQFVWSINLRSLQNFLNLRLNKNAHFEIRYVAGLIKDSLKNTYIESLLK